MIPVVTYTSPSIPNLPAVDEFNPAIDNAFTLMEESIPEPEWLVDGWWVKDGMGIIGGTPKTRKSTLAMELAVSIATGSTFLGLYPFQQKPVPVLMVQEENTRARVRYELESIFLGRGLLHWEAIDAQHPELGSSPIWMHTDPIHRLDVVSASGFTLTTLQHLRWLEKIVRRNEYRYVFFDPLYMVGGGIDINSAAEVVPVLRVLTRMKDDLGAAPILVHHQSGKWGDDPRTMGARLMGTTMLHGWYECAVFPTRTSRDDPNTLTVHTEFRDKPSPEPFTLEALGAGRWRDLGALTQAVLGPAGGNTAARRQAAIAGWLQKHPEDRHNLAAIRTMAGLGSDAEASGYLDAMVQAGLIQ